MTARAQVDHLVVVAASLAQGVQWCEATLGITPGPGGVHALMGTHNRLLSIATPEFPRAYLEIIAINPGATPARPAGARRWFDMDDAALQARVAQHGPQLVHFVASVPDAAEAVQSLHGLDLDRGPLLAASRPTAAGLLQWQISVRDDGQRLLDGCLPTLIQWGATHPADAMAASGVTLLRLHASHPQAALLHKAYGAIGLDSVTLTHGAPRLTATLQTPKGLLELSS